MRGIYSSLTKIRRKVFVEVAKLAYEGNDYSRIENLPYKVIPGEVATYRDSIFLERAIVGERIRLTMGLSLRPIDEPAPISKGIEESIIADKYYEPPLINIIKFACNKCPDKKFEVSSGCQACGLCKTKCPYDAILKRERPCAKACGMDAIETDEYGNAHINYDKCVSCGMCLVSCPFGAIADKSQIFQLIQAIKAGDEIIAAVAPAFIGQFGPKVTPEVLKKAMQQLGFKDVVEVAIGADLCTIDEAKDFLEKVPAQQPFMATSCCPSWSMMAKKEFPEFKSYISMALTPMVLTARLIKEKHPNSRVVFVGPCAAKKLEASRKSVRSEVDFVLTFEEIGAMFEAKGIDFASLKPDEADPFTQASSDGRGFAVSGGVAKAVVNCIKAKEPEREVLVESAEGLANCKKMLKLAKSGKYDGYLLEGMACPGGCVAGAGTLLPITRATTAVKKYTNSSDKLNANDSKYKDYLERLIEEYK